MMMIKDTSAIPFWDKKKESSAKHHILKLPSTISSTSVLDQQQQQTTFTPPPMCMIGNLQEPLVGAADSSRATIESSELVDVCMIGRKRSRREEFSAKPNPWVKRAWAGHFALTFLIILYGSCNNHQRKYISVDSANVSSDCRKAFVNVYAFSEDDTDAFICCPHDTESNGLTGICDHTPDYLIFARRLSRFPEAWTLPFYPFVIRAIVALMEAMRSERNISLRDFVQYSATFRRLSLFMGLLLIRLLVLYSFFNVVEEQFVSSADQADGSCWYSGYLRPGQPQCSGRVFDFSDHVVLYFAQLLPVMLAEGIYSFAVPFWGTVEGSRRRRFVPLVLVAGMLYMYFICFLGAYKTAAYFHTPAEIFFGYAVSLLIQVPLCLVQCHPKWVNTRRFLFGSASTSGTPISSSLVLPSAGSWKVHESDAS